MTSETKTDLGSILRKRGLLLATAESCTGGLIAHLITNVPGSSDYYLGGVVAYSNDLKQRLLGVATETLQQHGAVSEATAIEMARGARERLGAHLAVSVTGIAGPGGGSAEKPVGLTWIGLATPDNAFARRFVWEGDRGENKLLSAQAALEMVAEKIDGM